MRERDERAVRKKGGKEEEQWNELKRHKLQGNKLKHLSFLFFYSPSPFAQVLYV